MTFSRAAKTLSLILVRRTHNVQGTICSRPEQLGMGQFYDKNFSAKFSTNFQHREFWILADLDSASEAGTLIPDPPPPPPPPPLDIGNFKF